MINDFMRKNMIKNKLQFLILIVFASNTVGGTSYLKLIEDGAINFKALGVYSMGGFCLSMLNGFLGKKLITSEKENQLFDKSYHETLEKKSILNNASLLKKESRCITEKLENIKNTINNEEIRLLPEEDADQVFEKNIFKEKILRRGSMLVDRKNLEYIDINQNIFKNAIDFDNLSNEIINESEAITYVRFHSESGVSGQRSNTILKNLFEHKLDKLKKLLQGMGLEKLKVMPLIDAMMTEVSLDIYVAELIDNKSRSCQFDKDIKKVFLYLIEEENLWARLLFYILLGSDALCWKDHYSYSLYRDRCKEYLSGLGEFRIMFHFIDINFNCLHDCVLKKYSEENTLNSFLGDTVYYAVEELASIFQTQVEKNKKDLEIKKDRFSLLQLYNYLPGLNWLNSQNGNHWITRMMYDAIDGFTWAIFFILMSHLKYEKIENLSVPVPLLSGMIIPCFKGIDRKLSHSGQNEEEDSSTDKFVQYCEEKQKEEKLIVKLSGLDEVSRQLYLKQEEIFNIRHDNMSQSYSSDCALLRTSFSNLFEILTNKDIWKKSTENYLSNVLTVWQDYKKTYITFIFNGVGEKEAEEKESSSLCNDANKDKCFKVHSVGGEGRCLAYMSREIAKQLADEKYCKAEAKFNNDSLHKLMEGFLQKIDFGIKKHYFINKYLAQKEHINYQAYFQLRAMIEAFELHDERAIESDVLLLGHFKDIYKNKNYVIEYYNKLYAIFNIQMFSAEELSSKFPSGDNKCKRNPSQGILSYIEKCAESFMRSNNQDTRQLGSNNQGTGTLPAGLTPELLIYIENSVGRRMGK
jgi:hypothetical protein